MYTPDSLLISFRLTTKFPKLIVVDVKGVRNLVVGKNVSIFLLISDQAILHTALKEKYIHLD